MNARITDAATLSALRPLEVVAYLRSNGWTMSREKAGSWSMWLRANEEGDEFEVTVPLNHQFRDFAARMGDVLHVLETFEVRSQLQILRDLVVTGAKESSRREEFEIRGSVVRLERMDGADIGKATIHGLIDDQPRKVVVELRDTDYHKAVAAHDEARFVRCSGVLAREGRSFRLYEPYGFDIEEDDLV
jgi:hypothetical protein